MSKEKLITAAADVQGLRVLVLTIAMESLGKNPFKQDF